MRTMETIHGSGEFCMNEQTEKPASLPPETSEPAPQNGVQAAEEDEVTAAHAIKSTQVAETSTENRAGEQDGGEQ